MQSLKIILFVAIAVLGIVSLSLLEENNKLRTELGALSEYAEVNETIKEIINLELSEQYKDNKCFPYSEETVNRLKAKGILSDVIVGKRGEETHAAIAIWIEPQTGELLKGFEKDNEVKKIIQKDNKFFSYK